MMLRTLVIIGAAVAVSQCGGEKSPTSPSTPTPTETRIISLGGNMDFGRIQVGQSFSATLDIRNTGNAPLTVTGMTGPSNYSSSFTSGTIPAGGTQQATIRFAPTQAISYNGTLTVNGNHTGGTNTIAISGQGSLDGVPTFFHSGVGDSVFNIPAHVSRIKVDGAFSGSCQNFIVRISTQVTSLINVIIGTCSVADTRSPFSGTYAINGGGQVTITSSTGIHWAFTELR